MPNFASQDWAVAPHAHVGNWHVPPDEIAMHAYGSPVQPWMGRPGMYAFARASAKYVFNDEGRIVALGNNVQEASYDYATWVSFNNLLRSEEFDNAAWTKTRSSIDADTVANPLDGEITADTIIEDNTVASSHYASQGYMAAEGNTYTASVYVRAINRNWLMIDMPMAGAHSAYFDVLNGAVGTTVGVADVGIENAGDGWWRCWMSVTAGAGDGGARTFFLMIGEADNDVTFDGLGTDSLYLYGAQLDTSTELRPYVPTGANIAGQSDGAYCYSASNAKTNICLRSEEFDNAAWASNRTTETANQVLSPAGDLTADSLNEDNTLANTHYLQQNINVAQDTPYTFSVFVKRGNRTWVKLRCFDGVVGHEAYFDVDSGAVGTTANVNADGTIVIPYPNGWYRCCMAFTTDAAAAANVPFQIYIGEADNDDTFDGLTQVSLYLWGAQVETQFFTHYIPTVAASVTRALETEAFAPNVGLADILYYTQVHEGVPGNYATTSVGPTSESGPGTFRDGIATFHDGVGQPAMAFYDVAGAFDLFYFQAVQHQICTERSYLLSKRFGVTRPWVAQATENHQNTPALGAVFASTGIRGLVTDTAESRAPALAYCSCIRSWIMGQG